MDNKKKSSNLITIRGVVIPAAWDDKGEVIRINIATFDEEEYFVEENETAKDLYQRLGQGVEVTGIVKKVNRKRIMKVVSLGNGEIKPGDS